MTTNTDVFPQLYFVPNAVDDDHVGNISDPRRREYGQCFNVSGGDVSK